MQIVGRGRHAAVLREGGEIGQPKCHHHADNQQRNQQFVEREAILATGVHEGNIRRCCGHYMSIRPAAGDNRQAVEIEFCDLT